MTDRFDGWSAGVGGRPGCGWSSGTGGGRRIVLPGVRMRGSAVGGRREYYGPLDLQHLTTPAFTWPGANQGPLAPVTPRVRFGFESMPRTPSLTRVVTLVEAG